MPRAAQADTGDGATAGLKNRLYGQAMTELRRRHQGEFDGIVGALYEENGLVYRKRLSPEERAAEQVRAILAEYPDLAAQLTPTPAQGVEAGTE